MKPSITRTVLLSLPLILAGAAAFAQIALPPGASPQAPQDPGYRWQAKFKYNAIEFTLGNRVLNPTYPPQMFDVQNMPSTYPQMTGGRAGTDATADIIWMTVPRATFETKAGAPLTDGATIEVVKVWSEWLAGTSNPAEYPEANKIAPTGDAAKWTVGDDYCFGPPPAALSNLSIKNVQYGDATTISAKLLTDAGAPAASKPVQIQVGTDAAQTVTTNADGVATATFTPKLSASSTPYPVTVTFAGDATDGKAKLTGTLTISPEKTVFAPLKVAKTSATARTITATLNDDDKKPVAGVKVDWLVNGKKVATLVTNSKGQVVYKGAKAGQYVQLKSAAVSGKYLAATSSKVKV